MTSNEKNIATLMHLSTLTQYFIPFGNYIFPIVIWSSKKNDSEFIDFNGKQVLNFQLSMLLYSLILLLISIPTLLYSVFRNVNFYQLEDHNFNFHDLQITNISGIVVVAIVAFLVFFFMKIMEFFLIIYAAVKTTNGENYKYPLAIQFFK
jgi:uncharacterized Tic20 family protein